MGAPNYWVGPSISSVAGGAHCISFVQGLELLKMLSRRILELKAEVATFAPHPAPVGLQIRLEDVEDLFRWMKPIEDDEQFGTQFMQNYNSWETSIGMEPSYCPPVPLAYKNPKVPWVICSSCEMSPDSTCTACGGLGRIKGS